MRIDYNALIEQMINGTLVKETADDPRATAIVKVMGKHGITGLKAAAFLADLLTEFGKIEEAERLEAESGRQNKDN